MSPDLLTEITARLVSEARPLKVILFGSRARGSDDPRSDIDLIVVEREVENPYREMIRLRRALRGLATPIDLLVISERDFDEKKTWSETVYYWAHREGRTLYEAA